MLPPDQLVKQIIEARNKFELCYHFVNLEKKRRKDSLTAASYTDTTQHRKHIIL